jgi:hypothetical protein
MAMPGFAKLHFGGDMYIDPDSPVPGFSAYGALIGGSTSLVVAVYTQRHQDRLQRVAGDVAKRETIYADFVMSASNFLQNAYTHDEIALGGDEQRLVGLMNRMRLFAPPDVVDGAEMVLKDIEEALLEEVKDTMDAFRNGSGSRKTFLLGMRRQAHCLYKIELAVPGGQNFGGARPMTRCADRSTGCPMVEREMSDPEITLSEIAQRLHLTERTLRRFLKKINFGRFRAFTAGDYLDIREARPTKMPLTLVKPQPGKGPNWGIRGTLRAGNKKRYLNETTGVADRGLAETDSSSPRSTNLRRAYPRHQTTSSL